MKIERKHLLATTLLLLPLLLVFTVKADNDESIFRWDLISVDASINLRAGGQDSAGAADNSFITLTGSGTFVTPAGGDGGEGSGSAVTGGGTWETFDPNSVPTGSGTYKVTRLVRFTLANCTVPTCVSGFGGTDLVLPESQARAGLAVLEIKYSDESRGVLVVSCGLNGTPPSVFEGIVASKDSVEFWNQNPFNAASNATIFHKIQRADEN
jgi:hypothetical protein